MEEANSEEMDIIKKITKSGKEIYVLDFSDLKENQMMEAISAFRDRIIKEGKPFLVLGIFSGKTYLTPRFMRHFETDKIEVRKFITRQAVIGLSETQLMILKGFNTFFKRDIKAFATQEEAINYLVGDSNAKN